MSFEPAAPSPPRPRKSLVRRFFSSLGPGLITGAADDDPSGVATYSVAGAQLGTSLLWSAALTWPLMATVQMMCARIGMVTGQGLAGAMRKKFPKWLLVLFAAALFVANTINIASDLAGMADAAEILTGWNSHVFVVVFGAAIAWATVRLRYYQLASILKWLAVSLFAYVFTAILSRPDWREVARAALVPRPPQRQRLVGHARRDPGDHDQPLPLLLAGRTGSRGGEGDGPAHARPARGGLRPGDRQAKDGRGRQHVFSNLVMFFIILTTALTLHRHGITRIESSREAALALKPLAGSLAELLYAVGIIGVGLLAIPTLAGSAAYAFAETFRWRYGLDLKLRNARYFYGVVILSTTAGIALDFADVNPIQALYWTAILNGLLAPFLLIAILAVASDREIMAGQPSSRASRWSWRSPRRSCSARRPGCSLLERIPTSSATPARKVLNASLSMARSRASSPSTTPVRTSSDSD